MLTVWKSCPDPGEQVLLPTPLSDGQRPGSCTHPPSSKTLQGPGR